MRSEQNKGYLMVFATGVLWGTIGLFSTILSRLGMDSSGVAFYRLLAASILLVPVLASVETVAAAIIGLVVFQQTLSIVKIAGIALVFISIVIMNLRRPAS